jgi:hypothetical protein
MAHIHLYLIIQKYKWAKPKENRTVHVELLSFKPGDLLIVTYIKIAFKEIAI